MSSTQKESKRSTKEKAAAARAAAEAEQKKRDRRVRLIGGTAILVVMALATALYGFLGLYLSFRFACHYTEERWAWLATLGIWFASSLPVYMYFNPSWSHAHSVFIVAAFLWYWHRTREGRRLTQWVILGLISGLVLDVYYANIAVLLVPLLESLEGYWRGWGPGVRGQVIQESVANASPVLYGWRRGVSAHDVPPSDP